MNAKRIAIAQQKGGVGKTTTTLNLGAALVERGRRVLLIDLDPQGALSAGVGVDPLALKETIYDVLRSPKMGVNDITISTSIGCDLVPSNIDLAASELELVSEPGRERILREKLVPVIDKYDYILIDCPPSLSLLTLNALSASSGVIIPMQTQYFALRGMDLLLDTVSKVQARINPELSIVGILPTLHNANTLHATEVLRELTETYKERMFLTTIPLTVKLPDSAVAGESIFQFTPKSNAAVAYRRFAEEVESRV